MEIKCPKLDKRLPQTSIMVMKGTAKADRDITVTVGTIVHVNHDGDGIFLMTEEETGSGFVGKVTGFGRINIADLSIGDKISFQEINVILIDRSS